MTKLQLYLEDLENRIDADEEERLASNWLKFANGEWPLNYFKPKRKKKSESCLKWPKVRINDALDNYDAMIYHELCRANEQLRDGGGELLSFRSNYGTVILPSLFGAEICFMPYDNDMLPSSKPLNNAIETIKDALSKSINVKSGYALKPFEAAERLKDVLKDYPKLSKYLYIYTPDTQSPAAILEALLGTDYYYAFYDAPDLVSESLELITHIFIEYIRAWHDSFPPFDDSHQVDWGMLHKGHCLIRDDAATNISAQLFKEFLFSHEQRIFDELNGGAYHFCGHGDHLAPHFSELNGLYAVNLSQPELNDMNIIYKNTIQKNIPIFGMANSEVNRCLREGIDMKGLVHAGLSIAAWLPDTEDVPDNYLI